MHMDLSDCSWCCSVYRWDKPPVLPNEELLWMDKGGTPFIGWSINVVGPFMWDEDGNHYLFVAMDPVSKWVKTHAMPSLHSWRAAKFLYDDLVALWGKPHYIWTDNGTKFVGSFTWL